MRQNLERRHDDLTAIVDERFEIDGNDSPRQKTAEAIEDAGAGFLSVVVDCVGGILQVMNPRCRLVSAIDKAALATHPSGEVCDRQTVRRGHRKR
jgi:hypothetical protein